MLKRSAIFAAAVLIVSFNTYAQTSKTNQAENSQKPSQRATVPPMQQDNGAHLQPKGQQHIDADVKVVDLPPKDWQDKAGFWINLALAVAGFAGIWVAICTLSKIERQTKATEDAAKAGLESANAAYGSVNVALAQLNMMKEKERARIEVDPRGLRLQEGDQIIFWNLKSEIELRNVGAGRAYVQKGKGELRIAMGDATAADPDFWISLIIVGGYIDPGQEPVTETFYFFQDEEKLDLAEYAKNIYGGKARAYMTGFFEYDTVGAKFHRDFDYEWVGDASPDSVAPMLHVDGRKPTTDAERVSYGYWRKNRSGKNDEYEIKPNLGHHLQP